MKDIIKDCSVIGRALPDNNFLRLTHLYIIIVVPMFIAITESWGSLTSFWEIDKSDSLSHRLAYTAAVMLKRPV